MTTSGEAAPALDWLRGLALVIFACFTLGAASGAHPYDVGELVGAAASLGGSHAPGQPLHALLGHLAMLVPLGSIAFRLSILSALGAALAAWGAGRATLALVVPDRSSHIVAASVMLATAALPAVTRNAMRPEVYTCALACVTLSAWALAARAQRGGPGLRIAALLAALAFALHPPHALVIAALGIVSCVARRPSRSDFVVAVLLGLASVILALAYLPIRGAAGASMWGDPTTPSGLFAYLTGAAYQRNLGAGDEGRLSQLASVLRYLLVDGGGAALLVLPLAVARRAQRVAWSFAAIAIVGALLQPLEERNPDNVAYFAPSLALVLVAAGASLAELSRANRRAVLAAPMLVLAPLGLSIAGGHVASAELPYLETLSFETIDAPAPRALLVTRTDFVAGAVMMSQSADVLRPDLAHFVEGLATSSWHWRSLRGHPLFDGRALRTATTDTREAFVEGAIGRARGHVEVDVENAARLEGHGSLRGTLLVLSPSGAASGVDERSMAERTLPAVVATAVPVGDHEAGAQVVRNVALERSELLFARERGTRSAWELRTLSGEPLEGLDEIARLAGATVPLVRDPAYFLASREDLVRQAAVILAASGRPAEATAILEAQAERGDDRALLQLAWIQLGSGLAAPARVTLDAYRAAHGSDVEADRLDAALQTALR